MKTIQSTEVLVYYDGVEVFAGQDSIGGHYIGMIIEESGRYLVTGVAPEQLRKFRGGNLDLRTMFLEAPDGEWFVTRSDGDPGQPFLLEPHPTAIDLLPEEGFYLDNVSVDDFALQQARQRGNIVFEFSAEPPETAGGHRIRMTTLAGLLLHLQTILQRAYRAALRDLPARERQKIDTTDGYLMDVVVPAAQGSYRVVLEAAKQRDMFGSSKELVRGLKKMDDVFASATDPDKAPQLLQPHKGHLAGSYVSLMHFLQEHETGLRYGWADPAFAKVQHGGVSEVVARQLADSLSSISNLATETVSLVGSFERVNTEIGYWGLLTEEGRKSGKVREGGPSLRGLTTGKLYRFDCTEEIEVVAVGREKHTLYLEEIKSPDTDQERS